MKLILIIILNCFLIQSNDFIEEVTNDFKMNSNFLKLNIESSGYKGSVIIENDDFYLYYYNIYHKDKEHYKLYVKNILKKNSVVDIGNENTDKWNFIKVNGSKKVNNNLKNGLKKFINTYFNQGKVIKKIVTDKEQNFIIKILFEHKIATYVDDETGYLVIKTR